MFLAPQHLTTPPCVDKCRRFGHTPSGMAVQLVKDRVVAVLEHEVKLPLSSKDLDEIHQVGVFQLLHRRKAKTNNNNEENTFKPMGLKPEHQDPAVWRTICGLILSNKLLTEGHKHAVAPDNPSPSCPIYELPSSTPTYRMTN